MTSPRAGAPLAPLSLSSHSRPNTSGGPRRNSLGQRRRVSLSVLPGAHHDECTLLPALTSVQSLLHEEGPSLADMEAQFQQITSQLETNGSLSPSRKNAPGPAASQGMTWRVLLLSRTFKEHSEDHVIEVVAEVFQWDQKEAASRVATASDKLMHVLDECTHRKTAFEKMQALRSRGLTVEVTSEMAAPDRERKKTGAGPRRHSFSSVPGFSSGLEITAGEAFAVKPPLGSPTGTSPRRRRASKEKGDLNSNSEETCSPSHVATTPLLAKAMAFEVEQTPADAVTALFEKEEQEKKERAEQEEKLAKQAEEEKEESEKSSDEDDEDEIPDEVVQKIAEPRRKSQTPRLKALIKKHRDELFPKQRKKEEGIKSPEPQTPASQMQKKMANWESVLDMLEVNSSEPCSVSPQRKEACDMMRFLCFGIHWILGMTQDGERLLPSQIDAFYTESIGTKDEVKQVLSVFHMLDSDRSGRIDMAEMQSACDKLMKQRFNELQRHLETEKEAQLEAAVKNANSPPARRPSTVGGNLSLASMPGRRPSVGGNLPMEKQISASGSRPAVNGGEFSPREVQPESFALGVAPRRNVKLDAQDPVSQRESRSQQTPRMGRRHTECGAVANASEPGSPVLPQGRRGRRASEASVAPLAVPAAALGPQLPMWAQPSQNEDKLDTARAAPRALEKLTVHLLGKKSSFTLEDMMRTIWMKAKRFEVDKMKKWCNDFIQEARNARVQTPPVLHQAELDGLKSVFKHYDSSGAGGLSFDQLVALGLIYEDQKDKCREEWDDDGNGVLDIQEFCQMMCPAGYRATVDSQIGTLKDGTRVKYDIAANLWRYESTDVGRLRIA